MTEYLIHCTLKWRHLIVRQWLIHSGIQPAQQAFLCSSGAKNYRALTGAIKRGGRGRGRGRKEGSFLRSPPPPRPSFFCSRPIFRAGKTLKTPFFALCSTETLARQAKQMFVTAVCVLFLLKLNGPSQRIFMVCV